MDYVIIYTILKFQLFNGLGYKSPTLLIYLQTFWKIPEKFFEIRSFHEFLGINLNYVTHHDVFRKYLQHPGIIENEKN